MTSSLAMKIDAFAKVNLTLEVFGLRPDGYHALRSVVVPVSLCDTVEVEPADELSSDSGYSDDLCLKAAKVLDPSRGARIHVVKRIPAGGGLGGGSADAAAVLIALNELWRLGHSRAELAEIGAQVGSDVPALVTGGSVLMEGRGEKVAPIECPRLNLVLCNPGVHTSTAEVYSVCKARDCADTSVNDAMMSALHSGDLEKIAAAFANDLTAAACGLHPEISEVISSLSAAGAIGVSMSGSGSTVFALVSGAERARELSAEMTAKGYASWPVVTR